jgi:hypothetical protein
MPDQVQRCSLRRVLQPKFNRTAVEYQTHRGDDRVCREIASGYFFWSDLIFA